MRAVRSGQRAVLAHLNLLHNLTERGAVSRSVLSANTDLLSSLTLQKRETITPQMPAKPKNDYKQHLCLFIVMFNERAIRTIICCAS